MLINNKKILFNFSSSYTGGGLKRLISFSEWFDSHGGAVFIVHEKSKPGWKNIKHSQQWINTLTTYAFPKIGLIPVADLKVVHFADVLRPIWLSKSETATRVKQRCHSVMKWCFAQDLVMGNPLDIVDELLPKQQVLARRVQHLPSMPWRDIPDFIEKNIIEDTNVTKSLLEFIIHTVARSGEARGIVWNEIDLENDFNHLN
mgnify:CR=1 FL=1